MAYPFDCITDVNVVGTPLKPADVILVPGGSIPQLMERARTTQNARYSYTSE